MQGQIDSALAGIDIIVETISPWKSIVGSQTLPFGTRNVRAGGPAASIEQTIGADRSGAGAACERGRLARLSGRCRLTGGPARLSEGQSYPSPKEREPDDAKYQYRKAGTDHWQRHRRRADFRLACFVGCFDNYSVLF